MDAAEVTDDMLKLAREIVGTPRIWNEKVPGLALAYIAACEENEGLRAALRAVHDWRGLCDANELETWERIAAEFYRETGWMRPGKDVPAALVGHSRDARRGATWDGWAERKNRELDDTIKAALRGADAAEGESDD